MEIAKKEFCVLEDASERANEAAINALSLLQLVVMGGGGGGDVVVG